MPYTDHDAAEAMADALADASVVVNVVVLRDPPGRIAYEFRIPQPAGRGPIYAKVHLGSGVVLCRSFHPSDYAVKPHE